MEDADGYAGWSYRPTREEIRRECERDEYRSGSKTYDEGGVLFAELSRGEIVAAVRGYYRNEAVHLDDNTRRHRCSCRNSAWVSGHCEHVVAVLLYMADNMEDIEDAEQVRLDSADTLLERAPPADLRDFVADRLRNDPVMYSDFLKRFKLSDAGIPRNYARLLKNLYGKYGDQVRGTVRFGRLFKIIRQRREMGMHAETTSAYRTILESIHGHMDMFDDDQYYADCLAEALEGMADSVAREDLPPDKKRDHISYLFSRCTDIWYDDYWPHYRMALEAICDTPADLEYWRSLVKGRLDADPDTAVRAGLHHMEAHILHTTGSTEAALDLLSGHYSEDRDLCLKYALLLRHAGPVRARRAGEQILAAYPDDVDVIKELLPLYDDSSPAYPRILGRVFLATGEWEYLSTLKRLSRDWSRTLKEMAGELARSGRHERVVDMYLKEGMHHEAMGAVESANDIDIYEKYVGRLAKMHPERYAQAYGNKVRIFIKVRSARDHYENARRHLESIRDIPRSEAAFRKLLSVIRAEHSRKYVLQEVLRGL
ncbi:MAG: hypothetical protein J4G04_00680 [Nitrosopumilaceae archaeon]|nr:hypothetical protein [Nitrosopumilaceae archaeon]